MEPRIKVFPNSGGRPRPPEPLHETTGSRKTRRRGTSPKPHPTEHEGESPRGEPRARRAFALRVSRQVAEASSLRETGFRRQAPGFSKPRPGRSRAMFGAVFPGARNLMPEARLRRRGETPRNPPPVKTAPDRTGFSDGASVARRLAFTDSAVSGKTVERVPVPGAGGATPDEFRGRRPCVGWMDSLVL